MGQTGQPNEHEERPVPATLEDCQAQLTEARREIGDRLIQWSGACA
jgi:hypothetical protein